MGKKYIIELEDTMFHKKGESGTETFLWRVKGFNSLVFDQVGFSKLTPYTEPDLKQVRKEAYDKGFEDGKELCPVPEICHDNAYQKGLSDAWEAARKLWEIDISTLHKIFYKETRMDCYMYYTATEVIEKLKANKQEKEEMDTDKKKVIHLANEIGIHKLYSIVRDIRGE